MINVHEKHGETKDTDESSLITGDEDLQSTVTASIALIMQKEELRNAGNVIKL